MSQHSNNQDLSKCENLTTATVVDQSTGAKASTSRLRSKFTKVFSSKTSKPAASSTSTLTTKITVGTSQDKVSSKFPVEREVSQSSLLSRPIAELWDEAYNELSKKDKSLIFNYEEQLSKSMVGAVASSAIAFSGLTKIQRSQQMRVLLELKIKEIDENKWKLNFKNHELTVKELIEPVVGVVEWAKDYVGSALEPSPYGSIAWAGVCLLLPLVLNPSKQEAARVNGLDHIANIISRCNIREALYHRRYEFTDHNESKKEFVTAHIKYRDALRALYLEILDFQATSVCFLSENTTLRVTSDMVTWNKWDEMLAQIVSLEDTLKSMEEQWRDMKFEEECKLLSDRHVQRMKGLSAIENEILRMRSAIMQTQKDEERRELLRWLCSADPSINYNSARESHALSTGDWLLEKSIYFNNWKKLPNSLLWLHGKAGAGKSFLSSSVINHLEKLHSSDPYTAVAYFYFSFNDLEKQSIHNMLRSLIVQLCGGRPDTPKSLLDLRSDRDKNLQPGLEKLEEALQASIEDFKSVYLIIDALDECPLASDARDKLLSTLKIIHGWNLTNLHVLCTSRPEADIKAELLPLFLGPATSIIDLQQRRREIDEDIGTYVDQRTASSQFRSWSPEIKEKVKAALMEKADGMFQYVAMQLKALQKAKSLGDITEALKHLPAGLDETYNRALLNIDSNHQANAIRSLTWLAFSMRPLKLSELAEASIIDPRASPRYDKDRRLLSSTDVLDFLSSFVIVDDTDDFDSSMSSQDLDYSMISEDSDSSLGLEEDNLFIETTEPKDHFVIRLAHFSIKEYLVSDRIKASECSMFRIEEIPANLSITESCLTCLLQFDKPDSLTLQTAEFPLLQYAAKFWTQHAQWAGEDAFETHSLIMDFFLANSNVYCNWIRIANWAIMERREDDCASPLYYASCRRLNETIRLLLKKGADVNSQGGYYGNALQAASYWNFHQTVQLLLEKGADVNAQGGYYSNALQAASYEGNHQIVQLLVEKGADVNTQGGYYGNALQAASSRDHHQIVQLLLEKGADVNTQGGYFGNALQAAIYGGFNQIVQLLLEKGADVNVQGGYFGNALQAASYGGFDQIVQLLFEKGADVNAQGGYFGNALQAAIYGGFNQIVQLLLEKGADVNVQGGYYGNALQAASHMGDDQIVQLLLEKGADVNVQSGYYGDALQAASYGGRYQIVQLLLEKGADINAQGGEYGNALQAASSTGEDRIVQLLLEKGAKEISPTT